MELSDIQKSIKSYPVAWITGGLSLVIGAYLYLTLDNLSSSQERLDELRHEVDTLKANAREAEGLDDDLQRFKSLYDEIDSQLIEHQQIAVNNDFFYALFEEMPIEVLEVRQRTVIEESKNPENGEIWTRKFFSVVPFDLRVSGYLTDLLDMLYVLDQCDRITKVNSFQLALNDRAESGLMTLDFQIHMVGHPVNES